MGRRRVAGVCLVAAAAGGCTGPPTPGPAPVSATPTSAPEPTPTSEETAATISIQNSPAPVLTAFVGTWSGHTRLLTISNSGLGKESISDGCCTSVLDLTFQLSDPQSIGVKKAQATATVTAVRVGPGWYAGIPAPVVGQQGAVTVDAGVITDHIGGTEFCDGAATAKSTCGA